ncbi:MAG TPA: AMP-binding protein [Candidatus Deferrimicrobium sp.]|nr:AMP-binding protein [Candidatus Deferrimicrobium sp.]
MKVGHLPRGSARSYPDEIALVFEKKRVTFAKFWDEVNILSQNFQKLGLRPGDRVALLLQNCLEYHYAYYAFPLAGGITTPFNNFMSERELVYCLNYSKPRFLIYQPSFEDTIQLFKRESSNVQDYISTDQLQPLITEAPEPQPRVKFSKYSTALIIFTGGTTGLPKGVMLSHNNVITMIAMAGQMLVQGSKEFKESFLDEQIKSKMLTALPLFHGAGLFLALCSMFGGITFITQQKFSVIETLKIIEDEKVTFVALVPTMLKKFMESSHLKEYNISSLRSIIYGDAPITPTVLGNALNTFPQADFVQVFGQTEASPVLCIMGAIDHARARTNRDLLASCGRALPGIEVKVVDYEGTEVPFGELGEIIARGENIMQGYWEDPDKTAQTLRDGWLHTGDLGKMDKDGYIYITGRGKDMIVSGGENIYPIEVEDVLLTHPAVEECAAIGVPDDQWGEAVCAIVCLRPNVISGIDVTETELIDYVKARIAKYKAPKTILFRRKLPKSPQGKILKRKLREPFWKDKERQVH